MPRTTFKAISLIATGFVFCGQLLAQNALLCKIDCDQKKITLAAKHACCPGRVAKVTAGEKLAQNCSACLESRDAAPTQNEALQPVNVAATSVSELDLPLRTLKNPEEFVFIRRSQARFFQPLEIPLVLHRFLI